MSLAVPRRSFHGVNQEQITAFFIKIVNFCSFIRRKMYRKTKVVMHDELTVRFYY